MNKQLKNITRDVLNGWNHDEDCVILVSSTPTFGGTLEEGAEIYLSGTSMLVAKVVRTLSKLKQQPSKVNRKRRN